MTPAERSKRIEEAARVVIEEASWVYSGCPDKYVRDLDVAIKALDAALEPAPPREPFFGCPGCHECDPSRYAPPPAPSEECALPCPRCGGKGTLLGEWVNAGVRNYRRTCPNCDAQEPQP